MSEARPRKKYWFCGNTTPLVSVTICLNLFCVNAWNWLIVVECLDRKKQQLRLGISHLRQTCHVNIVATMEAASIKLCHLRCRRRPKVNITSDIRRWQTNTELLHDMSNRKHEGRETHKHTGPWDLMFCEVRRFLGRAFLRSKILWQFGRRARDAKAVAD